MVGEVYCFFIDWLFVCELVGMDWCKVLVDLGFGFGKMLEYNFELLCELCCFVDFGVGVYVGFLCKLMIGVIIG